MGTYKYEVILPDGGKKKGTLEAADLDAANAELRASGAFVVSLQQNPK